VVRGALGTQGRLDGVVNAAGIVAFGDLVGTDPVVVEELFLVNALGPLWLAQAVLPTLAERRGFFANISGVVPSGRALSSAAPPATSARQPNGWPGRHSSSKALSRCRHGPPGTPGSRQRCWYGIRICCVVTN
jgi:NAD(P)-dependent dehydrogenase (short-subunit alcohol dehydrogenase family)